MNVSMGRMIVGDPQYTMQIGHLVSMMDATRWTTVHLVRNLSMEELDYIHDEQSNSIGALLAHIAAIEFQQQVWSFENRDLTEDERRKWGPALQLGEAGRALIHGYPIEAYIDILQTLRNTTYSHLQMKSDTWLYEEIPHKQMNQYYRWFHVMQDEISHRGQMKWLIQRLGNGVKQ